MASGRRGAVTVQAHQRVRSAMYRAKAPVKVSPASSTSTTTTASSTHIPPIHEFRRPRLRDARANGLAGVSSRDPDDDRPDSYRSRLATRCTVLP